MTLAGMSNIFEYLCKHGNNLFMSLARSSAIFQCLWQEAVQSFNVFGKKQCNLSMSLAKSSTIFQCLWQEAVYLSVSLSKSSAIFPCLWSVSFCENQCSISMPLGQESCEFVQCLWQESLQSINIFGQYLWWPLAGIISIVQCLFQDCLQSFNNNCDRIVCLRQEILMFKQISEPQRDKMYLRTFLHDY